MQTFARLFAWSALLMLGACSDSDSGSDEVQAFNEQVVITALDGYLYNAEACLDVDEEFGCESDSTSTDQNGQASITITSPDHRMYHAIVDVIEGQSIDLDEPDDTVSRSYQMRGMPGHPVVSPMTTVLMAIVGNNPTRDEIESKEILMKVVLQLNKSTISLFIDYLDSTHYDADELAAKGRAVAQLLPQKFTSLGDTEAYDCLETARDAIALAQRTIEDLDYSLLRFREVDGELQVYYNGQQVVDEP